MLTRFSCRHNAMATLWEAVLWGNDDEHLGAVATAVWDEVDRVERLLSRFNPASEVSRINRKAAREAVRVDWELADILQMCMGAHRWTGGYFDITATCRSRLSTNELPIAFDFPNRTIQFQHPGVSLDFGAFGKGHALDCAAKLLREFHVSSALIHGGTSSVIAIGGQPDGVPWPVQLREGNGEMLFLSDAALSVSSTFSLGEKRSDVIDPHAGHSLQENGGCAIISRAAATAEILSTALLSMGRSRALEYSGSIAKSDLPFTPGPSPRSTGARGDDQQILRCGWCDLANSNPRWEWWP